VTEPKLVPRNIGQIYKTGKRRQADGQIVARDSRSGRDALYVLAEYSIRGRRIWRERLRVLRSASIRLSTAAL